MSNVLNEETAYAAACGRPEKKGQHPASFFRALLLFCTAASSDSRCGVVTVASFQASNYILDGMRLIACHGGNQENGECLRLSILSFIRQQLS